MGGADAAAGYAQADDRSGVAGGADEVGVTMIGTYFLRKDAIIGRVIQIIDEQYDNSTTFKAEDYFAITDAIKRLAWKDEEQ